MCIFSQTVEHVSGTHILARMVGPGVQALVYEMTVGAAADLAMVLPLPTPVPVTEDALELIDLSRFPSFFDDLAKAFPGPQSVAISGSSELAANTAPLKVHQVGAFEASFVPRVDDFDRLDARFRLPPGAAGALPQLADYSFAVFKLRGSPAAVEVAPPQTFLQRLFGTRQAPPSSGPARPQRVHPMAFTFPTRHPEKLYFPTVHVHDGSAPAEAAFDHALYAQGELDVPAWSFENPQGWQQSERHAGWYVHQAPEAVLSAFEPVHHLTILGVHPNRDVLVALK